jgi:hypothetical protein
MERTHHNPEPGMRLVDIPHTPPLGGYVELLEKAFRRAGAACPRSHGLPDPILAAARAAADARDRSTFRLAEIRLAMLVREYLDNRTEAFAAVRGGDAA